MCLELIKTICSLSLSLFFYFFSLQKNVTRNKISTLILSCPTYRISLLLLTDFCAPEKSHGFLWTRTPVDGEIVKQCSLIDSNWTGDTLFNFFVSCISFLILDLSKLPERLGTFFSSRRPNKLTILSTSSDKPLHRWTQRARGLHYIKKKKNNNNNWKTTTTTFFLFLST